MLASRRSDAGRRRIGIKGRENSSWQVGKSLVSAAEASERGGGGGGGARRWGRRLAVIDAQCPAGLDAEVTATSTDH
ncbi:hypothetical protein BCR44DRAFT_1438653, partial [Catenaria anguillulae PL171]